MNGPTDRPAALLVRSDLLDSGHVKGPADMRRLNVAVGTPSSTYYVQKDLERGEPIATAMNTQGLAKTVAITGDLVPGSVAGALAVSPQFARNRPEAAQRFVTAFLRGARDYYSDFMLGNNKDGVIQSLIEHTTIKDRGIQEHSVDLTPYVDFRLIDHALDTMGRVHI